MKEMTAIQRKNGDGEKQRRISASTGRNALIRKEFADHLASKRVLILILLIGATCFAGLYGAVSVLGETLENSSNYPFLNFYTLSGNSIPSVISFMGLLGPLVGLALGFDTINSEQASGTLNRLIAQPIYRDAVIVGKFLSGTAVIALIVYTMGIAVGAVGILTTGVTPTTEEALRVLVFLTFTIVYIAFWLALSILFSVLCRHAATSALAVIALWIFFAIFMSMVANIVANAVYPISTDYQAAMNTLNNYTLELNINRISPYYLFSEAVSTIMNPAVRSVNVVTMDQVVGALSSYLSFGQSLLLVWPHLVGLIALMMAAFGISYIGFMRREVRAS